MRLSELVSKSAALAPSLGWKYRKGAGCYSQSVVDREIRGIRLDSRQVESGDLFVCVQGHVSDGHDFAQMAVQRGAVALLVDRWLSIDSNVDQVKVSDVRSGMAWLAAVFNRHPSEALRVVAVTGTNGKSTTAHLIKEILNHADVRCGLVGTLTGTRTTPDALHLQAILREMLDEGLQAVAMEVSSHALTQDRVLGVQFDLAVFTNLSPEHLDYHGSVEEYFAAKALLFRTGMVRAAVVNDSDEYGRRLIAELAMPTTPYSADKASEVQLSFDGSSFTWRGQQVTCSLPGSFNIENALAAAEATRMLGIDDALIASGLSAATQVSGRFEVVANRPGPTVIVDYAHTPAALASALESVRSTDPSATVYVVFGAGGERDREKRPVMGAVAGANADHIILTSDNPRSENPDAIIAAIQEGVGDQSKVEIEPDRRQAIALALAQAGSGDVILIAGKGHETTQAIGAREFDFDDRNVVRELTSTVGLP